MRLNAGNAYELQARRFVPVAVTVAGFICLNERKDFEGEDASVEADQIRDALLRRYAAVAAQPIGQFQYLARHASADSIERIPLNNLCQTTQKSESQRKPVKPKPTPQGK